MTLPLDTAKLTTRQRVRLAAEQLTAAGQRVTQTEVRKLLGSRGSDTTIHDELVKWRSTSLAARAEPSAPETPLRASEIPHAVAYAAERLYLKILAEITSRHELALASADARTSSAVAMQGQLAAALIKRSDEALEQESLLRSALEENAQLRVSVEFHKQAALTASSELAQATAALLDLQARVSALQTSAAEKESLSLARAEALSKHLHRLSEEQRASLAAPLQQLRERVDILQSREQVLMQQNATMRDEIARLRNTQ